MGRWLSLASTENAGGHRDRGASSAKFVAERQSRRRETRMCVCVLLCVVCCLHVSIPLIVCDPTNEPRMVHYEHSKIPGTSHRTKHCFSQNDSFATFINNTMPSGRTGCELWGGKINFTSKTPEGRSATFGVQGFVFFPSIAARFLGTLLKKILSRRENLLEATLFFFDFFPSFFLIFLSIFLFCCLFIIFDLRDERNGPSRHRPTKVFEFV